MLLLLLHLLRRDHIEPRAWLGRFLRSISHSLCYFFISCLQSVCSLQAIFNPGTLGKKKKKSHHHCNDEGSSDARYTVTVVD